MNITERQGVVNGLGEINFEADKPGGEGLFPRKAAEHLFSIVLECQFFVDFSVDGHGMDAFRPIF
jgi:hypothetical protein